MEVPVRRPELRAGIALLPGIGERRAQIWRPTVRTMASSVEAMEFGIVFVAAPQRVGGGDRFLAGIVALAWPDPATDWLSR